jgi:hypothetical protein
MGPARLGGSPLGRERLAVMGHLNGIPVRGEPVSATAPAAAAVP